MDEKIEVFGIGLSNFYGSVCFYSTGEEFFMSLGDHSSIDVIKISKELFGALEKEFKEEDDKE